MTKKVWNNNKCEVVRWSVIIVESTPGGERRLGSDGRPSTMSMAWGGKGIWEHCFANCMTCWKSQKHDFFDAARTANPYKVEIDNLTIPQLGCCGCVICNECVIEGFNRWEGQKFLACPYCAEAKSFNKDVKAWMLSEEVFSQWTDFRR
jgi:hypothetical protein